MKIKNVEKFRNDIYAAIKDAFLFRWEEVEASEATWKGDNTDFEESMKEFNHYDFTQGDYHLISLAQPLKIKANGKVLYLTVDKDGVNFYKSEPDRFSYRGTLEAEPFQNRLGYVMYLASRINDMMKA